MGGPSQDWLIQSLNKGALTKEKIESNHTILLLLSATISDIIFLFYFLNNEGIRLK